jgi:hypothetical protein
MSCGVGHLGFPICMKNTLCRGPSRATAGLSLTLDPMGKMFQNASSLKALGQLKPNCPGMIIGMSFTKLLEFHIGTKKVKLVEDHPMNIHVQFGFNHICSF